MKIKQALVGIAAAFAFGAVAIASDFGAAPSDFEAQTVDYFGDRLTDPRAARYEFTSAPYQVFADLRGYEGLPCWAVDVRVKARMPNGTFGGYVPYTVLFLDGEAIALEEDTIRLVRA